MKNTGYLLLALLLVILFTAACSKNKIDQTPEVIPPTPLELARAAADSGAVAFTDKNYPDAMMYFTQSRDFYIQAAPTAAPTDSVDINIERTQLNIALVYMSMASENVQYSMYEDALSQYESAAGIYTGLVPLTITATERDGYVSILNRNMALTAENAGQYERALTYYDKVLAYEPGNADILKIKYRILKDNIKDKTRAYQVLKDYAENSKDFNAYLILADAYKTDADNTSAGMYYDKALELSPTADVYRTVADFYRGTGNYQKSNTILEKLIASGGDNTSLALAYRVMAGNYDKLKNNAKKIESYEKSFALEKNADVGLILANYYKDAKNWDRVISYSTQVISLDSSKAAAYLLRGSSYYMKKKYPEAKADLLHIQNDRTYGKSARDLLAKIK